MLENSDLDYYDRNPTGIDVLAGSECPMQLDIDGSSRAIDLNGLEKDSFGEEGLTKGFALSGVVTLDTLKALELRCPDYEFVIKKRFQEDEEIVAWRMHFKDILMQINDSQKTRGCKVIPLDFVGIVALISTLSSLVNLKESDFKDLPAELKQCQESRTDKETDEAFRRRIKKHLKKDGCRFRWFVCKFMTGDVQDKELIAQSLYKSVRCGLVHGLNIGQTFGKTGYNIRCSVGPKNPFGHKWYGILDSKAAKRDIVFCFDELFKCVKELLDKLFDKSSKDPDVQRFLRDAEKRLKNTCLFDVLIGVPRKEGGV